MPEGQEGAAGTPVDTGVSFDDVVHIEDHELASIADEPVVTDKGEGSPEGGEGKGAAEQRYVMLYGQKVALKPDGTIEEAELERAISGKYIPEATHRRELGRLREVGPRERPARQAPQPPGEFKRAENPVSFDEDPGAWYKHEHEQDRLQYAHDREVDRFERTQMQRQVSRERYETELARTMQEYDRDFDAAATKVAVAAADSEPGKNLRDRLWNMVAHDPRHEFNPVPTDDDGEPDQDYPRMTTEELLGEYWGAIKSYADYQVAQALKSLKTKASGSEASPHKGGGATMPVSPAAGTRPRVSPTKEGETAWEGIKRDLATGVRAPGGR